MFVVRYNSENKYHNDDQIGQVVSERILKSIFVRRVVYESY